MNKKIIIPIFLVILISLVLGGYIYVKNQNTAMTPQNTAPQQTDNTKLEVATDAVFPEIKGQLYPGFPEFPVYPDAKLVASARITRSSEPDKGYRVKWDSETSVPKLMQWYQAELHNRGWNIETPDDPDSEGEQVVQLSNDKWTGYLGIENEQEIEIVVELRKN